MLSTEKWDFDGENDIFQNGVGNVNFVANLVPDPYRNDTANFDNYPNVILSDSIPYAIQFNPNNLHYPMGLPLTDEPAYQSLMLGLFSPTDLDHRTLQLSTMKLVTTQNKFNFITSFKNFFFLLSITLLPLLTWYYHCF